MVAKRSDTRPTHRPALDHDAYSERAYILEEHGRYHASQLAPKLEEGNSKVGFASPSYDWVAVWNLPPLASCPQASTWCRANCYNGQARPDTYRVDQWWANFNACIEESSRVQTAILHQISLYRGIGAIRIHSSGDFYSNDYITLWINIVEATPNVSYWAYTRSWADSSLIGSLNRLRRLPSVQLFASHDSTMPSPPVGWRTSSVVDTDDAFETASNPDGDRSIRCPEEYGASPNCATCKYCLTPRSGGVWFTAH